MALVTLDDAKVYLRVDSADEEALINGLLATAEKKCADVARLTDAEWAALNTEPTENDCFELAGNRAVLRTAILFTVGYLFEHREEADIDKLDNTLRALLYAIREEGL